MYQRNHVSSSLGRILPAAVSSLILAGAVQAAPVDLNTWTANGIGNWNITSTSSVTQTNANQAPGALFSSSIGKGYRVTGTISATNADDDFIGWVVGYTSGGFTSASADYVIIDWKRIAQTHNGGTANAGLNAWRVTNGALAHNGTTWGHANPPFTHLAAGNNFGTTGWAVNTSYNFVLTFTHDLLELSINGTPELSIAGPFPDGGIGLYNYSQQGATYTVTDATLLNYTVTAIPGANGAVDTPSQTVDYDGSGTATFTPNPGYQITAITSDCAGSQSGNSYTVTPVRSDCTITPTYAAIPYTVTADPGANGSVDTPSQVVNYNGTATVTFTPNPGYRVDSISDTCGGGTQSGNSYTVNAVTASCTISVVYAPLDGTVTSSATPVPVDSPWALLGLSGLLLWAARRRMVKA